MARRTRNRFTRLAQLIIGAWLALAISTAAQRPLGAQGPVVAPRPEVSEAARNPQPQVAPVGLQSKDLYQRALRGTVWIVLLDENRVAGHGTGWVLDLERRLVVTNQHVVSSGKPLVVFFPQFDKGELNTDPSDYLRYVNPARATIIDSEHRCDLALLQLDSIPEGTVPLELADESASPGERLHTIGGKPGGSDGLWTYSRGIVRQINRQQLANGQAARVMQAQFGVNQGNSGGAVVNDEARVVAVVEGFRTDARDVTLNIDLAELRDYLDAALPLVAPKTAADFHRRAGRHLQEGRADQAIRDFTEALQLNDSLAEAYAGRGRAFLSKNDIQTALADFEDAIRINPSLAAAYLGRGMVKRNLGKLDDALQDLTQAIRLKSDSPDQYNQRGIVHYHARQYALAVEDFSRAIRYRPDDAVLYGNRADALQEIDRHKEAIEDLQIALELQPKNSWFQFLLAVSHNRLGRYNEALQALSNAVKLNSKDPRYHALAGDVLQNLGKHDVAVKAYSQAIALKQDETYCYFARGICYKELGRHAEAISDFDLAIKLVPKLAAAYHHRGLAKQELGDRAAAIADLNQAAKLDPENFRPVADADSDRETQPVSDDEIASSLVQQTGRLLNGPDAPARITLVNPAGSGASVTYTLNGFRYTMRPGQTQTITADRAWTIIFGRGSRFGSARYSLSAGTYIFGVTNRGWELRRSEDPVPDPDDVLIPTNVRSNVSHLRLSGGGAPNMIGD